MQRCVHIEVVVEGVAHWRLDLILVEALLKRINPKGGRHRADFRILLPSQFREGDSIFNDVFWVIGFEPSEAFEDSCFRSRFVHLLQGLDKVEAR